jgi:putative PEP-CTERM system histidine kinase
MLATIAGISYSIAAAAFFLLFALLLVKQRGKKHGAMLALACAVTAVWAASVVYATSRGTPLTLTTTLLELARDAGWSAFLIGVLSPSLRTQIVFGTRIRPHTAIYVLAYCVLFLANIVSQLAGGIVRDLAGTISGSVGFIVLAVMGMILVEQLFRNTSGKQRWAIKFACLGVGALFLYDFYFYVDALLFRRVNAEAWAARGIANAFAVPLIAVSAARNPDWSVGISVSRRFLFQSATLLGAALYLLAVALAGYYLRFFGGEWGTVLQVTFLFGALILLAGILFSGGLRSWLKVFISKNFYNYSYDYREEWLKFTRTLSVDDSQIGERAVQAIAAVVESPKGVLYTRNELEQYAVAAEWNINISHEPVASDSSLCTFLKTRQWVVDVQEFDANPKKYEGLGLPTWLRKFPQAWLVIPLLDNGDLFGFVVLARARSAITMNWEVIDLLKIVAIQTTSYLAKRESANELSVARQFETFNRMSTFVVHDLKNLVSQLALLVANAEKHKDSPEFQRDMLGTIEHAVQKMRTLLQKFTWESATELTGRVSMDQLLELTVASKSLNEQKPTLEVQKSGLAVSANAVRLERVIGHLIKNAVEATPRDGHVIVRLTEHSGNAVIEVNDTGQGMSDEFIRTRLFKPFESTKSAGMGIGVFETRDYVQHLGGRLEVESEPLVGTTFRVSLPLYDSEQDLLSSAA